MRVYRLAYRRECRAIARKSRHGWRRKRTKAALQKQAGGLLLKRKGKNQAVRRKSDRLLANVNLDDDLKLLNAGDLIVVVGSRGRIEITPRDLMNLEASVTGMKMPYSTPEERRQYANLIARGAAVNHVKPPIAEVYSLDKAGEAHRQVIRGPHEGNLVIALN